MALISASRCRELACLELQFMQDFGDKISFAIAKLTKSRRQSRPNQSISFTQYNGNPSLTWWIASELICWNQMSLEHQQRNSQGYF